MIIRDEDKRDFDAIAALHRGAFGRDHEAKLTDALRAEGLALASLVAVDGVDGRDIAGHIMFSALFVEIDGRKVDASALAPLAVLPRRQGQGVGSSLVRAGLDRLRGSPCRAVIVLGHPAFYARFGFSAALTRRLAAPFHGDAFMAMELEPHALAGDSGTVEYPGPFGIDHRAHGATLRR